MDKELSRIIDLYWADYVEHKEKPFVVNPSIPIIWFGDMEAYKKSKLRVVTVAINPSNLEFGPLPSEVEAFNNTPFARFSGAQNIYDREELNDDDKLQLYNILNSYFKEESLPYTSWFNALETPLNCLNATYYADSTFPNTAIHIDLFTALATNKKWRDIRKEIGQITNILLFKTLLSYLRPDMIIFTPSKENLALAFNIDHKKDVDLYFEKSKNFTIETFRYNDSLVIYGRNNCKPFNLGEDWIKQTMKKIIENPDYSNFFTDRR